MGVHGELVIERDSQTVVPQHKGEVSIVEIIEKISHTPNLTLESMAVLERLVALQERRDIDARRAAYFEALSRLQAKLPQITKQGRIIVKGTERSRFARLEDIDVAIRPLLAEEGFAFSFNSSSPDAKTYRLLARLSHRMGHFEEKELLLPIDQSEFRSAVQNAGSTVSYGKRQLIKMHLNIVECDEDNDGNGRQEAITQEQADTLRDMLAEVNADKGRFLVYMQVKKLEEIPASDYRRALNAIETKRRTR